MHQPQILFYPNPTEESFSEVIYLETDIGAGGLRFVEDNFERLSTLFGNKYYKLVSIKQKLTNWEEVVDLESLLAYHFPLLYSSGSSINRSVFENPNTVSILSSLLLSYYGIKVQRFSGFMLFQGKDIVLIDLPCTSIDCIAAIEALLQNEFTDFRSYNDDESFFPGKSSSKESIVDFQKTKGDPANIADELFPLEAHQLAHEVMERVNKLKRDGFEKLLIESLSQVLFTKLSNSETHNVEYSRIRITEDYRIFLTDYGNLEVELTPLPKVVFLFFLRHPEGVMFKRLYEHKEELMALYMELSLRENFTAMQRSIDELVDPTKNSINEKCSRIKEAFVKIMDNHYASHYYITGNRGSEKRISIDRNLVSWNSESHIISITAKSDHEIDLAAKQENALIQKAEDFRNNGMRGKAIELLSGVIAANPYCTLALHLRAIAYAEMQQLIQAISDYNKVLEINDMHTSAYYNRAIAYATLYKYNDAINDLTTCISLLSKTNSLLPRAHKLRAKMFINQQNREAALSDFKIAASLGCEESKQFLENL